MTGWFGIKDPIGGIFAFIAITIAFFVVFFSLVACTTYIKEVLCARDEIEPYDSDDDQPRPRQQQQQQRQRQQQQPVTQQPVQQPRPSVPRPPSRQQAASRPSSSQQQQQKSSSRNKTTTQNSTSSGKKTTAQQSTSSRQPTSSQQQSTPPQQPQPQVPNTPQIHSTSACPGTISRPPQAQGAANNQKPPSYTPIAQGPPSYATDVELRSLEGQDVGVLKRRLEEIKTWADDDRDEVEAAISRADIDHLKDWIRKLEERQAKSKKPAVSNKPSASSNSSASRGT